MWVSCTGEVALGGGISGTIRTFVVAPLDLNLPLERGRSFIELFFSLDNFTTTTMYSQLS